MVQEMYERPYGVAYTAAVVESEADQLKLRTVAKEMIEMTNANVQGWHEPSDFHMTICLGELPLGMKMRGDVGSEVELHVTHFGFNDRAIAFKVTGYMSKNDTQHITMLFRDRPADSKEIDRWVPLTDTFTVASVIREIPAARP